MVSIYGQFAALVAVAALIPEVVLGAAIGNDTTTTPSPATATGGIDARMKAKGKKYLGIASDFPLLGNAQIVTIINAQFGALTPENSAKWDATEPAQNNFNFSPLDTIVNFAQANGKLVRGHTFVWHSQLPSWVSRISSSSTLTSVLTNHINTIAKRYAGKIYAWDVCNEIFNEDGSYRSSVWYNVLGFVAAAFGSAHVADPNAKLYISDYNLDNMNWSAPKVNAIANLVKSQIAAGTPIHGIGTQVHLSGGDTSGLYAAWKTLADSGIGEIAITELDIANGSPSDYASVVKTCLDQPKCVGITVWGAFYGDPWSIYPQSSLYDSKFMPTDIYKAIFSALS